MWTGHGAIISPTNGNSARKSVTRCVVVRNLPRICSNSCCACHLAHVRRSNPPERFLAAHGAGPEGWPAWMAAQRPTTMPIEISIRSACPERGLSRSALPRDRLRTGCQRFPSTAVSDGCSSRELDSFPTKRFRELSIRFMPSPGRQWRRGHSLVLLPSACPRLPGRSRQRLRNPRCPGRGLMSSRAEGMGRERPRRRDRDAQGSGRVRRLRRARHGWRAPESGQDALIEGRAAAARDCCGPTTSEPAFEASPAFHPRRSRHVAVSGDRRPVQGRTDRGLRPLKHAMKNCRRGDREAHCMRMLPRSWAMTQFLRQCTLSMLRQRPPTSLPPSARRVASLPMPQGYRLFRPSQAQATRR
mgnify:CR=1 FL=1